MQHPIILFIANKCDKKNIGTSVYLMIHIVILAVCSLRLDFETFTTQGLSASTELAAITCQDTFIISVSYPVISLRKLTI